jgi:hypothetical protein
MMIPIDLMNVFVNRFVLRKSVFIFTAIFAVSLSGAFTLSAQTLTPDYRDMVTFGQYLQQHRSTYSAYAQEKADLLKLSDSRDPAQINAEFQSKLNTITASYQEIYQSKVAAFNAGVGVAVGALSSEWQQLGGQAGNIVSNLFAGAAKSSAEGQAARDRARLTLEFEDKFFTLKEEVLTEKRKLENFYLMAAAFQLAESEEKKYLDLANYLDCECRYIEDNFSLAGVSWLNSNCPRPATTKYAAVAAPKEPDAGDLLATIKRKLSIPNIHFIRAARDFADIGMAKFPENSDFLFYRIYLSEDENEFDWMLIDELLKASPENKNALTLKKYMEESPQYDAAKGYAKYIAEYLEHIKKLSVGVAGNPHILIRKTLLQDAGWLYPVMRNGKMIYVTPDGEQAFEGEYEFATIFSGGYARVKKDGKWGVIDLTGNTVIPCIYAELMVSVNDYGIWHDEKIYTPFFHFDEYGYVCVQKITGKWGIFSIDGQCIIKPEEVYCPLILAKDRFVRVQKDKWHLFDANGNMLSDPKDDNINKGRRWMSRYAVVDGWFKFPAKYGAFSAAKSWTFMDINGNYVWGKDLSFDEIIDDGFKDGKCRVRNGKETFFIDKTGKRVD